MSDAEPRGKITDYFWKRDTVRIEVLNGSIQVGDTINITGEYTDVTVDVDEMEVDGEPTEEAEEGNIFAMTLEPQNRVVLGDEVYLAEDEE